MKILKGLQNSFMFNNTWKLYYLSPNLKTQILEDQSSLESMSSIWDSHSSLESSSMASFMSLFTLWTPPTLVYNILD